MMEANYINLDTVLSAVKSQLNTDKTIAKFKERETILYENVVHHWIGYEFPFSSHCGSCKVTIKPTILL